MELVLHNVTKSFGDKKVVKGVNLKLTSGVYGLLGSNGSGKTTLMRMLATILRPTSGKILLNNQDIKELDENYRDILGYLPQHVGYYKNFSAEKFLLYIASLKGLDKKIAKERTEELLKLVNLYEVRKKKIKTFSGGMKQRIGIAQALLNEPKILLVDEPTAGLDPKERIRFRNLLSAISRDKIVLLSTHIVSDIEFIAKELLIMKNGQLIEKNDTNSLLQQLYGKVWEVTVPDNKLAHYQQEYKIGSMVRTEQGIKIRILSDQKPMGADSVVPNLEDLYLYYFDQEVEKE
jgi:ABC-2 type transport system ATP-binding protein